MIGQIQVGQKGYINQPFFLSRVFFSRSLNPISSIHICLSSFFSSSSLFTTSRPIHEPTAKMKFTTASLLFLSSLTPSVLSAPTLVTPPPVQQPVIGPLGVEIHSSCNATERTQLWHALAETKILAENAAKHILDHGPSDPLYKKYFGNGPSAEPLGWFTKLANDAPKPGVLLRCDDIDGNCHQDGWAGHWRGANATEETVICELSYTARRPLEQMCAQGYNVANYKTNVFFASDLVHRMFHLPSVSELVIDHYSDAWAEVIEFAKVNGTFAVRNTNGLQFFALEAYALDVAIPGVGCPGRAEVKKPDTTTTPPPPTTTQVDPPATTSDAPSECHTHDDGVVHCV